MSPRAEAIDALTARASARTGFSPEALDRRALERAFHDELAADPAGLRARVATGDPQLEHRLISAVSVGETYFFRHPEQFERLALELAGPRFEEPRPLRAWSAGCATGEEAYSLAASIRASRPDRSALVIGTDMGRHHLEVARRGRYRSWSFRASGPIRHPVVAPPEAPHPDEHTVLEPLRAMVRFVEHNLLEPPPAIGEGPGVPGAGCDLILCRNVLVYFSPQAARRALEGLISALAPGGLLILGTMDTSGVPAGLERVGPPELMFFERPSDRPPREAAPAAARVHPARGETHGRSARPHVATERAPPGTTGGEPPRAGVTPGRWERRDIAPLGSDRPRPTAPVARHVEALEALEGDAISRGTTLLAELVRDEPGYLPGLVEHALLLGRTGRVSLARSFMARALERARGLADDTPVPGPEALPARYYRLVATRFLERREG